MPTYDYLCPNGHRFEVIHSVTGTGPETCPACGAAPVRKAFSAPSIHFKGSGWAKKDRSSARRPAASASGSGDSDGDGRSDKAGADDKPATDAGSSPKTDDKKPATTGEPTKTSKDSAATGSAAAD